MIELDELLRNRLATAIDDRIPVTAAYVTAAGKPHVSFYGSVHVYGDDRLALWVRNPDGELPRALAVRAEIAISYGNIGERYYGILEGRGRVVDDSIVRDRVYAGMHAIERIFDPEGKGVAVLVDLDQVTLMSAATGKQVMRRADG